MVTYYFLTTMLTTMCVGRHRLKRFADVIRNAIVNYSE